MKKYYTTEEKLDALRALEELGPAKAHEQTGIPSTTLYRWKKQFNVVPDGGPVSNASEEEDAADYDAAQNDVHDANPDNDQVPQFFREEKGIPNTASREDIETAMPGIFLRCLQNKPEMFANSVIVAIRQLFRDNDALVRENSRLRQALRVLLDKEEDSLDASV